MVKQIIRDQYRKKFNRLTDLHPILRPKEGWIRTLRKALGMSGLQLGRRMGISTSQVSQMERMEVEDRITIKQLRRVAEVMGCDLVYALVPREPVEGMVKKRASLKARALVAKADVHMSLEAQKLSDEQLADQMEYETQRLVREMPRDLWED